ncbi:response regulator [Oxalobacteraceae bacterium OTU3CAMAD1]|nr:response regulator [Oxalobacteraceae bacterium OTU3CAMAD1]
MRVDTLRKFRKLFGVLVAAVAVVLLIVLLGIGHVLNQSRLRYYASADETSRNLAITLEKFLNSHFLEVDLAMRRAGVEFQAMHAAGRFDNEKFSAYLRSLKERIPQADAVRGADAAGRVIYGERVDPAKPQDLSIREFFQRAKSEQELIIGTPARSRISDEWVLPLAFPLTMPDGGFGGAAYVLINSARLTAAFAALNIGEHGAIVLLDNRKRVLHRYPEAEDMLFGTTIKVNAITQRIMDGKEDRGTYTVISPRDNLERTLSVSRVGAYPVYVVVGLASDDFLAPWRKEVRNAAVFASLLLLLAGGLLMSVRFGLRKQFQSVEQLMENKQALQELLTQLTASESRWRSLTEGLPQMVWTATPNLRVDFLSHHWEEFSGIPPEQMMGDDNWSSVIHPDDIAAMAAAWRRASGEGTEFRCDCRMRRRDGVWRVFDNHALPQRDADGAIVSWVGSSTDRTESRASRLALQQAKEEAVQAGRAKSDFVANMSHEIRSPMNAVLGMLQLLQQTEMSERQQDYTSKAHSAASALLGLLNDILDFSKVEAGKLALDPHPFRLDKLWRDLAVILSANVGSKNIEVLFRIDPALPDLIVGDGLRLQQILLNLAGNAIKFTEHGEVVLSAKLLARDGKRLSIGFAIRDSGIGISEEQCRHIFDGFSQAEASTARRYGGTGLGLAISQRLVALMGGTLGVDSTPGKGSVFDFTIECEAAEQQPAPEAQQGAQPPAELMRGLKCLVVDDNPVARMVLSEMAGSFGWQVDLAASGHEALAAVSEQVAQRRAYDVVFIDWRMPTLDGWETSCQIRKLAPSGKMPLIVMVTAHDRELLAQQHDDLSPVLDGFVVKPVTASMLFDAVADARMERRAPLSLVSVPSRQRLAGLRLLLVDDNPANQQVASELLGNDGARVEVVGSGAFAIEAVTRGGPMPDLILMDIQMPEMDGYQATRAIRRLLGAGAPPIVAMTANAMAADRVAALEAGMVDHIGKPFDLAQLIDVILKHVGRGTGPAGVAAEEPAAADGAIAQVAAPAAIAAPAPAAAVSAVSTDSGAMPLPEAGLNSTAALKRMGGLQPVYLMALRSFAVESVKLATQLREARDAGDAEAALPVLHTLKGLSGTVGADRMAALAQLAEVTLKEGASARAWDQLGLVLDAGPGLVADIEQVLRQLAPVKDI